MRARSTVAVLAATLTLTACGGATTTEEIASLDQTEGSTTATTEASPEVSMEDGLIAFTECLREEGLDVGDPIAGPDGSLQMPPIEISGPAPANGAPDHAMFEEMEAVFAVCEPLLGEMAFTGNQLPEFDEFEDLLLEYAGCMRDNGVEMPDPDFSSDGGVIVELGIGDPTDPEFMAADEACRDILAGFGPGSLVDVPED